MILLFSCFALNAQSLFEDALSGENENTTVSRTSICELNGYLRGVFYGGKIPDKYEAEMKSGYSEASMKVRIRKQSIGDAFAEVRFRKGNEFDETVSEVDIREAYINIYSGRFDFRLGQQIVAWGRADGLNPTNNITPQNMFVRSPNEDDRKKGNFLLRSHYNFDPLRLEIICIPKFVPSISSAGKVSQLETDYPDANLKNSAVAIKLNLELASFDGSVSYFNGYNPSPGINIDTLGVFSKAYRMHIAGADFSATSGSYGFRGEFAFRDPQDDYKKNIYIPNPDLQYVLGIDREFGNLNIILQYVGRFVVDFEKLNEPQNPEEIPQYEISLKNRMFSSQTNEISHAVSFRVFRSLLHETLSLETFGLYNFTTEELFFKPKLSYDLADALTITIGGEHYMGHAGTLFDSIDETLSSVYIELKTSF